MKEIQIKYKYIYFYLNCQMVVAMYDGLPFAGIDLSALYFPLGPCLNWTKKEKLIKL